MVNCDLVMRNCVIFLHLIFECIRWIWFLLWTFLSIIVIEIVFIVRNDEACLQWDNEWRCSKYVYFKTENIIKNFTSNSWFEWCGCKKRALNSWKSGLSINEFTNITDWLSLELFMFPHWYIYKRNDVVRFYFITMWIP